MKRRMAVLAVLAGGVAVTMATWTLAARTGYETAAYTVVETDGNIEIRDYPDLMLAATDSKMDAQGRDGSFMRLFQYISGANENDQKIAMTTPVFMEGQSGASAASMGFVIPRAVTQSGIPRPRGAGVKVREREAGRFAVIRFSGRLDSRTAKEQELKLREWMDAHGMESSFDAEAAGYDPPFTPGPLRRNEVLIRLTTGQESATVSPRSIK